MLHHVFEFQAREDLRTRTRLLAEGASASLGRALTAASAPAANFVSPTLEPRVDELLSAEFLALNSWLESDPDFESVHLLDGSGAVLLSFPERVGSRETATDLHVLPPAGEARLIERKGEFRAIVPMSTGPNSTISPPLAVEVFCSTKRLVGHLQSIRWLFVTIFLLAGAVFAALALFLTRGVIHPIEELRRGALRIANGEANVKFPLSGDREIDEIARFVTSIAERRVATIPVKATNASRPLGSPADAGSFGSAA